MKVHSRCDLARDHCYVYEHAESCRPPRYLGPFAEHGIKVGISPNGDQAANDRHRRLANDRGSHPPWSPPPSLCCGALVRLAAAARHLGRAAQAPPTELGPHRSRHRAESGKADTGQRP
ncbi:hypothetical protein ACWEO1_36930 [Kitasatospora cineracea]